MSVFRVEKDKNYTVMSNYHFKEKGMSLKAKGLLSLMLSLPDDWDYTIEGLVAICKENRTSITNTLNELKDFHYLEIKKIKNSKGQFDYIYNIYEQPRDKKPDTENLCMDNLDMENPVIENQLQLNTNNKVLKNKILNNKLTNNNIIDLYSEICTNLPSIKKINDKRKIALNKFAKEFTEDEIKQIFNLANSSKFLTGQNDRGWKADFDFILKPDKATAILEGKYSNKTCEPKQPIKALKVDTRTEEEYIREMYGNV